MVGFTLAEPEEDRQSVHSVDRHSIASTVATTTSLASRIRDLNLFECGGGEEKDGDDAKDAEQRGGVSPLPEDPEEERESDGAATEHGRAGVPLSEEELSLPHSLHLLHRDPPLQVCCRLFERRSHPPLPLKRMSMVQVEDFRQHGYVVIDNFIGREAAARIKAEALRLSQRGLMQPVSAVNMADTAVFAPVMAALQEIQDDLSEFVRLRSKGGAEYCLCQLPPNSLPVPRHRDALPDDGRSSSSGAQAQQALGQSSSQASIQQQQQPAQGQGQPNGAAAAHPTSSDAGTTFSEISDCGSLRLPPFMGSTTSSVIAEASAPDHDTYSLDGISVAESEAERQGFEWVECEGGEMALDVAPLSGRVLLVLSGAVEHALLPSSGQGQAAEMVYVRAWCG
ncbi:hypothetical protein OEZ86_012220 [Tetradesmus obliquus]|nr:hypothetical protein OEZ86_012220 [Tetradesmus obliquus]